MDEINFYKDLKPLTIALPDILQAQYFSEIPSTWSVIISDVKNSTVAVNAGKYTDVNLVAAGSLIAVLNIVRKYETEIPFFFGGDGGTVLVPEQILSDVLSALHAHNQNSMKNIGLEMYIGSISIKDIIESGHYIKVAKQKIDNYLNKALIIGDGLRYAEQKIKHSLNVKQESDRAGELNLNGLECRWDKVKPPSEEKEIVCYLIEAIKSEQQINIYYYLLQKIEEIFGNQIQRHPISPDKMNLLISFNKLKKEMLARYGRWKIGYFFSTLFYSIIGKYYFKFNWKYNHLRGKEYIEQLISHADTLTIDGRINTIISGKGEQHRVFMNLLTEKEKENLLVFGFHASKESIITCYIENRNERHIHFVDGSDGGYTEASKGFKMRLQQMQL